MKLSSNSKYYPYYLFIFVLLFYFLILDGVPRADHLAYLLDLFKTSSFLERLDIVYSYNRTRVIAPGDTFLFRPVLFFYLNLVDCLFRTNFLAINFLGALLHSANVVLVYLIMKNIADRNINNQKLAARLALLISCFFAFTPNFIEQIAWTHIHGYLLSNFFILLSIYLLLTSIDYKTYFKIYLLWALLLIASFTYEINMSFAPLAAYIICRVFSLKGKDAFKIYILFMLIPVIYLIVDCVDLYIIHPISKMDIEASTLSHKIMTLETIMNVMRWLFYTIGQSFFHIVNHYTAESRILIPEWFNNSKLFSVILVIPFGMLLVMFFYIAKYLQKNSLSSIHPSYFFLNYYALWWLFTYSGINILGRMNIRNGPDILASNSYYTYIPFLCYILLFGGAYILIYSKVNHEKRIIKFAINGFNIFIIILSCMGIIYTLKIAKSENMRTYYLREIVDAINQVIKQDRFATFKISPYTSKNFNPQFNGVSAIEILYSTRIDQCNGQYEIILRKPYVASVSQQKCYPALIRPGSSYNFYAFENFLYGVLHWQSPYDNNSTQYNYLIKSQSMLEGIAQIQEKTNEQAEDIKTGKFTPNTSLVVLVKEGINGFNIIKSESVYYAILQKEGAFDIAKITSGGYSQVYKDTNLDNLLIKLQQKKTNK